MLPTNEGKRIISLNVGDMNFISTAAEELIRLLKTPGYYVLLNIMDVSLNEMCKEKNVDNKDSATLTYFKTKYASYLLNNDFNLYGMPTITTGGGKRRCKPKPKPKPKSRSRSRSIQGKRVGGKNKSACNRKPKSRSRSRSSRK